jgi:cytochrome c peroxidase
MRHLARKNGLYLLAALLVLGAGCQKAARYGPPVVAEPEKAPEVKFGPHYAWIEPRPSRERTAADRPIRFVTADDRRWDTLKGFWNDPQKASDPLAARVALAPLAMTALGTGVFPLGSAAGALLNVDADAVLIKVPLGLPDPTPYIPVSNPPTVGKWELGRELFFDEGLLPLGNVGQSCKGCHLPDQGFTNRERTTGGRNTLSLINVVYNKRQFWDGRVEALEQVVQRDLNDEIGKGGRQGADPHAWPGVVKRLGGNKEYLEKFKAVFGTDPTIDNVGKALATYLRTILAGGSVYDWAEKMRLEDKDRPARLTTKHFIDAFGKAARGGDAVKLETGARLFAAHCQQCHRGPLLTDQDYHNIGIGDSLRTSTVPLGTETGHFAVLPLGLKDRRYVGAYRTPTLRALPRTHPYMHDGSLPTLDAVLKYYNEGLTTPDPNFKNVYLDPALRAGPEKAQHLGLESGQLEALRLFLEALDDGPPDPLLTDPKKKI